MFIFHDLVTVSIQSSGALTPLFPFLFISILLVIDGYGVPTKKSIEKETKPKF